MSVHDDDEDDSFFPKGACRANKFHHALRSGDGFGMVASAIRSLAVQGVPDDF